MQEIFLISPPPREVGVRQREARRHGEAAAAGEDGVAAERAMTSSSGSTKDGKYGYRWSSDTDAVKRTQAQIVVNEPEPAFTDDRDIETLLAVFSHMDHDKSGKISKLELVRYVARGKQKCAFLIIRCKDETCGYRP